MALMFPRIARNFAKNGYFPTDEQTVERLLALLNAPSNGRANVIDPCAGEGVAIAEVKHYLGKDSTIAYAVEYDYERATHAQTITDHCLRSDLMDTVLSRQAFGLLWLNPPYGDLASDATGVSAYQGNGRKRLEKLFYQRSLPLLQYDGILVFIIPAYVLDSELANWLTNHFTDLSVFEGFDKTFKQVVILGKRVRTKETQKDRDRLVFRDLLVDIGQSKVKADELPIAGDAVINYDIPRVNKTVDQFFRISMDSEQMLEEIHHNKGCWAEFAQVFTNSENLEQRQPARPLSDWHLALSLAAGAISGVIHSKKTGRTLVVKGDTYKTKTRRVEFSEDSDGNMIETKIDTDTFVPIIKAWEMTAGSEMFGQILSISDKPDNEETFNTKPLFDMGRVVMTAGVDDIVSRGLLDVHKLLDRHSAGDWGEISEDDRLLNQLSLNPEPDENSHLNYGRLFSGYEVDDTFSGESKIWIITEWDRSYTTVLLPSEY